MGVMFRRFRVLLAAAALVAGVAAPPHSPAWAVDIRATSGEWRPIEIVVEPFGGGFAAIIAADLNRSGDFRAVRRQVSSFGKTGGDDYAAVRASGGEYLLTGQVRKNGDGTGTAVFQLADAITGEMLDDAPLSINFDDSARRLAAHTIGNWIVRKLSRKDGVFHTKVAYILRAREGGKVVYKLRIADYDGYNAQTVLTSGKLLISPTWTPDGNALLYVSFEHGRPTVYWQSLLDGSRRVVANFKGSNSAPAMSPDGQTIAAALTFHGGDQQIYFIEENRRRQARRGRGINTEPDFSPDGGRMLLTSDENGNPQIYELELASGAMRRLTFGTKYAVSAKYSNDGALMVYVRRDDARRNNISLMDIADGAEVWLTEGGGADSPSFAANDTMVMFANERRPNRLHLVSINGKVLSGAGVAEKGEVADPEWSPMSSDWF